MTWNVVRNKQGGLQLLKGTENVPEGWSTEATTANPDYIAEHTPSAEQLREAAKTSRQTAVSQIRVTTSSGKTFDGDETSQTRMSRAIVGMQAVGIREITWVLSNNVPTTVTVQDLVEALVLSGQAQSSVWVI